MYSYGQGEGIDDYGIYFNNIWVGNLELDEVIIIKLIDFLNSTLDNI